MVVIHPVVPLQPILVSCVVATYCIVLYTVYIIQSINIYYDAFGFGHGWWPRRTNHVALRQLKKERDDGCVIGIQYRVC